VFIFFFLFCTFFFYFVGFETDLNWSQDLEAAACIYSANPCCVPLAQRGLLLFARNIAGHAALAGGKQKFQLFSPDPGRLRGLCMLG